MSSPPNSLTLQWAPVLKEHFTSCFLQSNPNNESVPGIVSVKVQCEFVLLGEWGGKRAQAQFGWVMYDMSAH